MRTRLVSPGFFTNEDLSTCSPYARLLFIGLWTAADREGRLEDRPRRLRAQILPYDEVDADELLSELSTAGFILRYRVAGEAFIAIPSFTKHQKPHVRETESVIPPPGADLDTDDPAPVPHPGDGEALPRLALGEPRLRQGALDPVSVSGSGSSLREERSTARAREGPRLQAPTLTKDQSGALDALHEQVSRLVFGGSDAPPTGWCEDLVRRGATLMDIEHAVQTTVARNLRGNGRLGYVRSCLEGRVAARERGEDPDARPSAVERGEDASAGRGGVGGRGGRAGDRAPGARGVPGPERDRLGLPNDGAEFAEYIAENERLRAAARAAGDHPGGPALMAGAEPRAGDGRGDGSGGPPPAARGGLRVV